MLNALGYGDIIIQVSIRARPFGRTMLYYRNLLFP